MAFTSIFARGDLQNYNQKQENPNYQNSKLKNMIELPLTIHSEHGHFLMLVPMSVNTRLQRNEQTASNQTETEHSRKRYRVM